MSSDKPPMPPDRPTPISLPPIDTLAEASNKTPVPLATNPIFLEQIEEISLSHQLCLPDVARLFRRLVIASPELHEKVFSDPEISLGMLQVAAELAEGRSILLSLRDLVTEAGPTKKLEEAPNETAHGISESVSDLSENVGDALQGIDDYVNGLGAEGNSVVPTLLTETATLSRQGGVKFEAKAFARPEETVDDVRGEVRDCLATIKVGLDRALTFARAQTDGLRQRLEEMEERCTAAAMNPDMAPTLSEDFEEILGEYDDCLGLADDILETMPQSTLRLLLDQMAEGEITALELRMTKTLEEIRSNHQPSDEEKQRAAQLEELLKGALAARIQKSESRGCTRILASSEGLKMKSPPDFK